MTYIDISTLITHSYVSLPVPSQSSPSKPKKLKSCLEFYQSLLQSLPEQDSHQSFKKALEDLDVTPEEKKLVVKLHRSVVTKLSLRETLRIALNDPKRFFDSNDYSIHVVFMIPTAKDFSESRQVRYKSKQQDSSCECVINPPDPHCSSPPPNKHGHEAKEPA